MINIKWQNFQFFSEILKTLGSPGGLQGKESACNSGDPGLIPGLGRSPGEGNGNPLLIVSRIPWTEETDRLQSMGFQRA